MDFLVSFVDYQCQYGCDEVVWDIYLWVFYLVWVNDGFNLLCQVFIFEVFVEIYVDQDDYEFFVNFYDYYVCIHLLGGVSFSAEQLAVANCYFEWQCVLFCICDDGEYWVSLLWVMDFNVMLLEQQVGVLGEGLVCYI